MSKTPKITTQNVLVLRKIDPSNKKNHDIMQSINDAFYQSETYFNVKINGNRIIVGKSLPKEKEENLSKRIDLRRGSRYRSFLAKSGKYLRRNGYNNSQKFLSTTNFVLNSLSPSNIGNNNKVEIEKSQISDQQIQKIFDKFQSINQAKSKQEKLIKFENVNVKRMLKLQEKILNQQKTEKKKNFKISRKILFKTKRDTISPDRLLMNSTGYFRFIKENRDKKESNRQCNEMNNANWTMSLRQSNINESTQSAIFNGGTEMRPNYITIFKKFPKFQEKTFEIEDEGFDIKEYTDHLKNENKDLKIRLKETKLKMHKSFSTLNGLYIKGKSLLQSEIENAKLLTGKKQIYRYHLPEKDINSIDLYKTKSTKNFYRPSIVNSCMKLHDDFSEKI